MKEIRELIRRLAERGVTVFSSGHLLHEVEQVCGRVTVLAEGRVVAQGSVSELLGGRERAIPKRSSAETKVSPAKTRQIAEMAVSGRWERLPRFSWRTRPPSR